MNGETDSADLELWATISRQLSDAACSLFPHFIGTITKEYSAGAVQICTIATSTHIMNS